MPKQSLKSRSRNWCFTLNNWSEDDIKYIHDTYEANKDAWKIKAVAYAQEIGDSGTPHLQGFICFTNLRPFTSVKTLTGDRAHIEMMRGSVQSNIDYCSKQGELIVLGKLPMTQKEKGEAGKKAYEEAWELAKSGHIEDIEPGLRLTYYTTLKRIAKDYMAPPADNDIIENYWLWGPTGTGKSRAVRAQYGDDMYSKACNKWWDGYVGQETVLLDDFDKKHDILGHHLKIWGDHYSFTAEVKGCAMSIRPKRIIVTSNYHPRDIWPDETTYGPIERRFKVICLDKPTEAKDVVWEEPPHGVPLVDLIHTPPRTPPGSPVVLRSLARRNFAHINDI